MKKMNGLVLFTSIQVLLSMMVSFIAPFLFFTILFYNDKKTHTSKDGDFVFTILSTPFICSIISGILITPVLPEGIERFGISLIPLKTLTYASYMFPFLGSNPWWRFGIVRHLMIGVYAFFVYVPYALVISKIIGTFSIWGKILFTSAYISSFSIYCIPLVIVGFLVEENYERVKTHMSMDPNLRKRMVSRIMYSPMC